MFVIGLKSEIVGGPERQERVCRLDGAETPAVQDLPPLQFLSMLGPSGTQEVSHLDRCSIASRESPPRWSINASSKQSFRAFSTSPSLSSTKGYRTRQTRHVHHQPAAWVIRVHHDLIGAQQCLDEYDVLRYTVQQTQEEVRRSCGCEASIMAQPPEQSPREQLSPNETRKRQSRAIPIIDPQQRLPYAAVAAQSTVSKVWHQFFPRREPRRSYHLNAFLSNTAVSPCTSALFEHLKQALARPYGGNPAPSALLLAIPDLTYFVQQLVASHDLECSID